MIKLIRSRLLIRNKLYEKEGGLMVGDAAHSRVLTRNYSSLRVKGGLEWDPINRVLGDFFSFPAPSVGLINQKLWTGEVVDNVPVGWLASRSVAEGLLSKLGEEDDDEEEIQVLPGNGANHSGQLPGPIKLSGQNALCHHCHHLLHLPTCSGSGR